MALLRSMGKAEDSSLIEGRGLCLRHPTMQDFEEWATLRHQSRDFLAPWEPTWPLDDLTRTAFRRRIRRYTKDIREDTAYPFFVYRSGDGHLVGGCTISNVRRGVTQSCSLGYWVGARYARQGFMSEAVRALVPYAFYDLRLNRVEAACLPNNEASQRLLRGVGFSEEGYARKYLRINGVWQDHLLFALVKGDPIS